MELLSPWSCPSDAGWLLGVFFLQVLTSENQWKTHTFSQNESLLHFFTIALTFITNRTRLSPPCTTGMKKKQYNQGSGVVSVYFSFKRLPTRRYRPSSQVVRLQSYIPQTYLEVKLIQTAHLPINDRGNCDSVYFAGRHAPKQQSRPTSPRYNSTYTVHVSGTQNKQINLFTLGFLYFRTV